MGYRPGAMDYEGPTPDPAWQEALDALSAAGPRVDGRPVRPEGRLSWLRLVWEPGDPWTVEDPDDARRELDGRVHRWVVYQMLPLERASPLVRADLLGPHPRDRYWRRDGGYYDRVLGRYVPAWASNVSARQWTLYRETGCYGRPYWIVQGTRGGHKRRWTQIERMVSRLHGGPKDPPLPGDLPYAPFDNRVTCQLAKLDRVRTASYLLARAQRDPDVLAAEDREQIERFRDELWDHWMRDQVRDAMELAPRRALAAFTDALPRVG